MKNKYAFKITEIFFPQNKLNPEIENLDQFINEKNNENNAFYAIIKDIVKDQRIKYFLILKKSNSEEVLCEIFSKNEKNLLFNKNGIRKLIESFLEIDFLDNDNK